MPELGSKDTEETAWVMRSGPLTAGGPALKNDAAAVMTSEEFVEPEMMGPVKVSTMACCVSAA